MEPVYSLYWTFGVKSWPNQRCGSLRMRFLMLLLSENKGRGVGVGTFRGSDREGKVVWWL